MKSSYLNRPGALFAAFMSVASLPATATAVDVFDFKGTVIDIGVIRGPHQIGGVEYRIEGKFCYDPRPVGEGGNGPLDLSDSTITFNKMFDQVDQLNLVALPQSLGGKAGAGELITTIDNAPLLPISLGADDSSEPDEAKYFTDGRFRPQFRVQIESKNSGECPPPTSEFQFNVRMDRALAQSRPFLALCVVDPSDKRSKTLKTLIRQNFTVNDHKNPLPLVVDIVKPWECMQPDRYHMRAR